MKLESKEEKELWKAIAIAVAQSDNCNHANVPTTWADRIVKDFRERTDGVREAA